MRILPYFLGSLGLFVAAVLAKAPVEAAPQSDGATTYTRCAACHLPTGAGVPGAFPPLGANVRDLAQSPDGRRYLVLVVVKGAAGPLNVGGKTYRGAMPAQNGLDDAAIAGVLNHVVTKIAGGKAKPFTALEVNTAKKSGATLNASAVAKLRPASGVK